jgi:hypothetical protein
VSLPRRAACSTCSRSAVPLRKGGHGDLAFHRAPPPCSAACSGGKIAKSDLPEEDAVHPITCGCARRARPFETPSAATA